MKLIDYINKEMELRQYTNEKGKIVNAFYDRETNAFIGYVQIPQQAWNFYSTKAKLTGIALEYSKKESK